MYGAVDWLGSSFFYPTSIPSLGGGKHLLAYQMGEEVWPWGLDPRAVPR